MGNWGGKEVKRIWEELGKGKFNKIHYIKKLFFN